MALTPQRQPGEVLAERYELREVLGVGGFGEVWLALDTSSADRPTALKILQTNRLHDLRVRARFIREAELLTRLDHPSIPRATDWRCDDALAFIALEYAEGQTLARRLLRIRAEHEPDGLRPLMQVFRKTCEAVDYAHSVGVVHRDLKPPNILIVGDDADPGVRVLDFGVAKILDTDRSDETTKGRVLGSQNYLSPEQLLQGEITGAADIFALGTILFELLSARRAWLIGHDAERLRLWDHSSRGPNEVGDVVGRILRGPRPFVTQYRPKYPRAIDEVIGRALAIEPQERWPTALELAEAAQLAMEEWLEQTRPAGLGSANSGSVAGHLVGDEQWAIPTNSEELEAAMETKRPVEPESEPDAPEVSLDAVIPTDLEAPPGEGSLTGHARRLFDTYAPFVMRPAPVVATRSQRVMRRLTSVTLTGFFAVGVISGVLRVWDELSGIGRAERPAAGPMAIGVVPGPEAPDETSNESDPSSDARTEPRPPKRAPRSEAKLKRVEPDPAPSEPTAPKGSAKLRRVEALVRSARASSVSGRADLYKFQTAEAAVRGACEKDLDGRNRDLVRGALDSANRTLDLDKLERAFHLYRRFAFGDDSDALSIDPLD